MPFPLDLESLLAAGYTFARSEICPVCQEAVEVFTTPGKREIALNPMCELLRPAVRHYETCNVTPKQEATNGSTGNDVQDAQGRDSDRSAQVYSEHAGREVREADNDASVQRGLPVGRRDAQGAGIKLYGVTDKNMIACGWQDGTLAIQFRYGLYHYANVPENVFVTLRRNPYPNNYFTKVVKNHPELYPCTKME
jgi:hypothetical protein